MELKRGDSVEGLRRFKGCIVVPRCDVNWYEQEYGGRVDRLGAFLLGICEQSNIERYGDKEYVDVLWPIFKDDKILWRSRCVPVESISFVPAEKAKEAMENWHSSIVKDDRMAGGALCKMKRLVKLGREPHTGELDDFAFCVSEISKHESESCRHFVKRKGFLDHIFKIRVPENMTFFWPWLDVTAGYRSSDHRWFPERWTICQGFKQEDLNPEELCLLSAEQVKRLAREYHDQLIGYIDAVMAAEKKLPRATTW